MNTATGYVVVGEAHGKPHDLGLFYAVLDADKFIKQLSTRDWGYVRIETRDVPLRDVHEAHVPLLTPQQRAERQKLLSAVTVLK